MQKLIGSVLFVGPFFLVGCLASFSLAQLPFRTIIADQIWDSQPFLSHQNLVASNIRMLLTRLPYIGLSLLVGLVIRQIHCNRATQKILAFSAGTVFFPHLLILFAMEMHPWFEFGWVPAVQSIMWDVPVFASGMIGLSINANAMYSRLSHFAFRFKLISILFVTSVVGVLFACCICFPDVGFPISIWICAILLVSVCYGQT
jgi:hypothetical protein